MSLERSRDALVVEDVRASLFVCCLLDELPFVFEDFDTLLPEGVAEGVCSPLDDPGVAPGVKLGGEENSLPTVPDSSKSIS